MIKPVGPHVLIEIIPVEEKSAGGIVIADQNLLKREKDGRDIGKVVAFGPTAYQGFAGCSGPEDWGVSVGNTVEFRRYDGKIPRFAEINKEYENYRIISDSDIIAVVDENLS